MVRWRRLLGISVVSMVAATGHARPSGALTDASGVRIRVYDYVGIPTGEFRRVKRTASYIFAHAGLKVDWMECRISQEHPVKDPRCQSDLTPLDLHLRIVGPQMAAAAGTHSDSFGYA